MADGMSDLPGAARSLAARTGFDPALLGRLLRLAAPMILSMTGHMLMVVVDGLFLARHSAEAIAAVGPAGMGSFCVVSLVTGCVGYTSTLTAHYYGAGQHRRIGQVVWQGIWLALIAGALAALLALAGPAVFNWIGHPPLVRQYETRYFQILSLGAVVPFVGAAVSGFFTGKGETRVVMVAHLSGFVANVVLDYAMIFGRFGFPEWGVPGAAIATVLSGCIGVTILLVLFFHRSYREPFGTVAGRAWDADTIRRLLRFGLPSGFRFFVEIVTWTAFLAFVGRLGTVALASTTIAWRINGIAFFPVVGLGEAMRILVGQAQGRRDHRESLRVTGHAMLLAEIWMVAVSLIFIAWPRELYAVFQGPVAGPNEIAAMGAVLLRFVTVYCLLDAVNIIVCGALIAAGDTRWTFAAAAISHALFVASLAVADALQWGVYAEWALATVFVMIVALIWPLRFAAGAWKRIEVIDVDGP